jgi:hypothetical protein
MTLKICLKVVLKCYETIVIWLHFSSITVFLQPQQACKRFAAFGGSGYEKPQSDLRLSADRQALCAVFLRHSLGQGSRTEGTMLRIAPCPIRQLQPKR